MEAQIKAVVAFQRQRGFGERDAPRVGLFIEIFVAFLPQPLVPPRLPGADGAELAVVGGHRHRLSRSEEHTSELQSLMRISYAVFCLKKKKYKSQKITYNS